MAQLAGHVSANLQSHRSGLVLPGRWVQKLLPVNCKYQRCRLAHHKHLTVFKHGVSCCYQ